MFQLCWQSICSICSACNRSVRNDCIVSNVSSDVCIVSNVSILGNVSIVSSAISVSNVSTVCNSDKRFWEIKSLFPKKKKGRQTSRKGIEDSLILKVYSRVREGW